MKYSIILKVYGLRLIIYACSSWEVERAGEVNSRKHVNEDNLLGCEAVILQTFLFETSVNFYQTIKHHIPQATAVTTSNLTAKQSRRNRLV
jgi:hypothetical protein